MIQKSRYTAWNQEVEELKTLERKEDPANKEDQTLHTNKSTPRSKLQ